MIGLAGLPKDCDLMAVSNQFQLCVTVQEVSCVLYIRRLQGKGALKGASDACKVRKPC